MIDQLDGLERMPSSWWRTISQRWIAAFSFLHARSKSNISSLHKKYLLLIDDLIALMYLIPTEGIL